MREISLFRSIFEGSETPGPKNCKQNEKKHKDHNHHGYVKKGNAGEQRVGAECLSKNHPGENNAERQKHDTERNAVGNTVKFGKQKLQLR